MERVKEEQMRTAHGRRHPFTLSQAAAAADSAAAAAASEEARREVEAMGREVAALRGEVGDLKVGGCVGGGRGAWREGEVNLPCQSSRGRMNLRDAAGDHQVLSCLLPLAECCVSAEGGGGEPAGRARGSQGAHCKEGRGDPGAQEAGGLEGRGKTQRNGGWVGTRVGEGLWRGSWFNP